MSPKLVSDLDFESRLALHTNRCKLKLAIYTVYLEICNFLQTEPNICNIYTKSKFVKWWSFIQGQYLKTHLCLAENQRFIVEPHRKSCDSPKMVGMDGLVLQQWVQKWCNWLEKSPEITKTIVATCSHTPPAARVAHRLVMKFHSWVHRQLLFLLV